MKIFLELQWIFSSALNLFKIVYIRAKQDESSSVTQDIGIGYTDSLYHIHMYGNIGHIKLILSDQL